MPSVTPREPEHVYIADRAAWRAWLAANYTQNEGIWLVYDKGGNRQLSYDDLVEEALCFGWIDSKSGKVDDVQSKLWLAPRRSKSGWSRSNKVRVERLIADGLMQPPGLAVIEAAKANGLWSKLDEAEALIEPPDLVAALDSLPPARDNWNAFPPSAKRAILFWIGDAKRAETRATRVAKTAEEAAVNRRANEWVPKDAR